MAWLFRPGSCPFFYTVYVKKTSKTKSRGIRNQSGRKKMAWVGGQVEKFIGNLLVILQSRWLNELSMKRTSSLDRMSQAKMHNTHPHCLQPATAIHSVNTTAGSEPTTHLISKLLFATLPTHVFLTLENKGKLSW